MAYTLTYELIDDNAHYMVTKYTHTADTAADDVVIPETYNGKPVTEIKFDAFKGTSENPNTTLISITIPDSITKIGTMETPTPEQAPNGSGAFAYCTELETVNMGKNVRVIGQWTFKGCTDLTHISLPNGLTSIGHDAFSYSGLTGITIPNSVVTMDAYVFQHCTNLKNATIGTGLSAIPDETFHLSGLETVNIPRNISSIGTSAFNETNLRTVIFNDGLIEIGANAFANNTHLTNVVFPQTLTAIGISAFEGCTAITEITIPTSVASFGYQAFRNCSSLETVTFLRDNPPEAGAWMFDGIHPNAKLYVYSTGIDDYKTATNFSRYANLFVADDLRIDFLLLAKSTKQFVEDKTGTSVDANFFDDIYGRV